MTKERRFELDDILLNFVNVSDEALRLALALNGINEETYSNILYYYTGYEDFEEFMAMNEGEV